MYPSIHSEGWLVWPNNILTTCTSAKLEFEYFKSVPKLQALTYRSKRNLKHEVQNIRTSYRFRAHIRFSQISSSSERPSSIKEPPRWKWDAAVTLNPSLIENRLRADASVDFYTQWNTTLYLVSGFHSSLICRRFERVFIFWFPRVKKKKIDLLQVTEAFN